MSDLKGKKETKQFSAADLRKICLEVGADDVGFVNIDRETAFLWQSLMFRVSYRCGYCVAVCPAGEELKAVYLQDKAAHIQQILKPLQERVEPVYVASGSKAESAAKRNPQKQVKAV